MSSDFTEQQTPTDSAALEGSEPAADAARRPKCRATRPSGSSARGRTARCGSASIATRAARSRSSSTPTAAASIGRSSSREVEKLVFLSADRYVVQLLDVGWDADPPYYVMEYVENGSLDDLLCSGTARSASAEAVEMFREIAVGLAHAHGKGVLHCDLKPANILLDQDHRPRLADFGQSRLSHEQKPALGTLFYMAPEQADLEAVPDVRWDVYALGAILYTPARRLAAASQRRHRRRRSTPRSDLQRPAGPLSPRDPHRAAADRASPHARHGSGAGRDHRSLPGGQSRRSLCQRAGSARRPGRPRPEPKRACR